MNQREGLKKNIKNLNILIIFLILCISFQCSTDKSDPPTATNADLSPIIQSFTGPSLCTAGETATYVARAYDPDGTKISYHFAYWLDIDFPQISHNSGYGPFVNNYKTERFRVTWKSPGEYTVCCHCKDQRGNESSHWRIHVTVN